MALEPEKKQYLIREYQLHEKDTGSPDVQIAMLSKKINYLIDHFKVHPKDFHSRRGLMKMVGRRKRLLDYLRKTDIDRYRSLIDRLKLRK